MPRTDDSHSKRGEKARGATEGEKPHRGEQRRRHESGKFVPREDEPAAEPVRKTGIAADRVKSVPDLNDDVEEGGIERKQTAGGYIDYDRQEEFGEEDVDYVAREETHEEE